MASNEMKVKGSSPYAPAKENSVDTARTEPYYYCNPLEMFYSNILNLNDKVSQLPGSDWLKSNESIALEEASDKPEAPSLVESNSKSLDEDEPAEPGERGTAIRGYFGLKENEKSRCRTNSRTKITHRSSSSTDERHLSMPSVSSLSNFSDVGDHFALSVGGTKGGLKGGSPYEKPLNPNSLTGVKLGLSGRPVMIRSTSASVSTSSGMKFGKGGIVRRGPRSSPLKGHIKVKDSRHCNPKIAVVEGEERVLIMYPKKGRKLLKDEAKEKMPRRYPPRKK